MKKVTKDPIELLLEGVCPKCKGNMIQHPAEVEIKHRSVSIDFECEECEHETTIYTGTNHWVER